MRQILKSGFIFIALYRCASQRACAYADDQQNNRQHNAYASFHIETLPLFHAGMRQTNLYSLRMIIPGMRSLYHSAGRHAISISVHFV